MHKKIQDSNPTKTAHFLGGPISGGGSPIYGWFMDGLWMVYGFGIENQIYQWMIWGVSQVSRPTPLARVCHPSPSWAGDFMWGFCPNFWSLGLQFDVPSKRIMAIMG